MTQSGRFVGWLGWTGAVTAGWLFFSFISIVQIMLAVAVGWVIPASAIQGEEADFWIRGILSVLTWLLLFLLGWVAGLLRLAALRSVTPITGLYPAIFAFSWVGGSFIRESWAGLVADLGTQSLLMLNSPNTVWLFSIEVLTIIGVAMVSQRQMAGSPRWIALGVLGAVAGCLVELLVGQGGTVPYIVPLALGGVVTGAISGIPILIPQRAQTVLSKKKGKKRR